jgi:enamine deaminase RidA (YjgF/YER057c/UK114 family)
MRRISMCILLGLLSSLVAGAQAQPQTHTYVRHIQDADRPIATGVWAGDTLYLSGQLASPRRNP